MASNETIANYLEENKKYLIDTISNLKDVESGRIKYLSAILMNKLGDYKPKSNIITINIQEEHYETRYKNKARIALEDLEEECYE